MSFLTVILIAIGLAMDCLAVTITIGFTAESLSRKMAFRIAGLFGLFHIFMPAFGWLIGHPFKQFIAAVDHWIAFVLLAGIGIKMIVEALRTQNPEKKDINKFIILLGLAFATSIDALIIGVSFAFLNILWTDIIIISVLFGLINFIISFLGCSLGKRFGFIFGERAEILGGLVLIGLGVKILLEHTLLKS